MEIINRERKNVIDILKGIGIFLMVFDHVGWGSVIHTYIQSFHMPLFFIVSGYLWHEKPLTICVKKRIQKLLVPYILYGLFYLIPWKLWNQFGLVYSDYRESILAVLFFPNNNVGMSMVSPLWFLICMFWTDILYSLVNKIVNRKWIKCIVIAIIAIIGTFFSSLDLSMLPLSIEPVATALVFYFVGDCLKERSELVNLTLRNTSLLFIVSVVFVFCNNCIDMRSARYHIVPLYFLNGILGTVIYWNIANYISMMKGKVAEIIKGTLMYLSINSIVFLAMNRFFIIIWQNVINSTIKLDTLWMKIFRNGIIFALTMLCCTILNQIFSCKKEFLKHIKKDLKIYFYL